MNKFYTLLLFACSFLHTSFCQQLQTDSLYITTLKNIPNEPGKVKDLAVITNKVASYNPQEAVKLARYIVEIATAINDKTGIAAGYNELGHAYERFSLNDSAFYYFFTSNNLYNSLNDPAGKAEVDFNIGNLHEIIGSFDSSAFYLYKSLHIADSTNNSDLKGKNNRILGNIMAKQTRLDEALQYYFTSLDQLLATNNFPELVARVQENIALVYIKKEEFKKAETYFQNAVDIYKKINEQRGLARANLNIANLRVAQGRYTEALSNSFYALNFYKKINHLNGIAESLMQLADAYFKMHDYNNAIEYAKQTIEIVRYNADRDIELSALKTLHKAYFKKGDVQKAYSYLDLATALNDSIFSDKKESIITELQTRYETQKKENEIALLNKDKELNIEKTHKQKTFRNAVIASTILILIIFILVFNRYRINQKNNRQKELIRISSDLHDEIGSTLSSISMYSSYAEQQLAENKTSEAQNILDEISTSSHEMIEDMNDIIWTINPRNDNFETIVDRLKNFASLITQSKCTQLHFHSDESLNNINLPTSLRKNIYLIIKEAMNNSIKYSACKNLYIKLERDKKLLITEIKDDGNGFDTNKNFTGNGLKNMRSRASQIKTAFIIESSPGEGTTIRLETRLK